jgi:hypothetical protein
VKLPPARLIRRNDTHRLIPSKYGAESVLARIADDSAHLADIFDLDNATNDRLFAENNFLPGIGIHELVFDLPLVETLAAHEGAEIGALGTRILARLVLGPGVPRMLAEALRRALARIGEKPPPTLVVLLDELAPSRIVEAAVVDGCGKRQAGTQR